MQPLPGQAAATARGSVPAATLHASVPASGLPLLLVLIAVAASRLPFLAAGYGTDTDAWRLAVAAREIGTTSRYMASRFPGYPVQEWLCAALWRGGPAALNGLSALFGLACAVLLHRLVSRLGSREGPWMALAFAFVPAVVIAGVSAMDYLFGLAFLLAAFEAALARRAVLAGVLLGLAIGSRVTSAAFLLPLAILWLAGPAPRLRPIVTVALLGAAIGAACYLPAWLRYGPTFFGYIEPGGTGHPGYEFVTGVFRRPASPIPLPLIAGQATVLVARGRDAALPAAPRAVLLGAASWVLLEVLFYLRLPNDEGYLVPAIPFALLLLARVTPRRVFRALAVLMVISSFAFGVDVVPPKKGQAPRHRSPLARELAAGGVRLVVDPLRGPVPMDGDKRARAAELTRRVVAMWDRVPPNAVVFAGTLTSDLSYFIPQAQAHLRYLDFLPRGVTEERIARGDPVYYLPDLPERVARLGHYDLRATGARPLFEEATARTGGR